MIKLTWDRALKSVLVAGAIFLITDNAKPIYTYLHPRLIPEDFVTITVAYDPVYCNSNETKRNIRITTINNSPKQIDATYVSLAIKESGRSGNIFGGYPPLYQDWIIGPGKTGNVCWYIPTVGETGPTAAQRQYEIIDTIITFHPGERDKK